MGRTVVGALRLHVALAPSVGHISQTPTAISLSASVQLGMDRLSCSLMSLSNSCSVSSHIQSGLECHLSAKLLVVEGQRPIFGGEYLKQAYLKGTLLTNV